MNRVPFCAFALALIACGGRQVTPDTGNVPYGWGAERKTATNTSPKKATSTAPKKATTAPVARVDETSSEQLQLASSRAQTTGGGLQIEQSLASSCDLALPNAFFESDSTELGERGSEALDALSKCLNSDALRGRSIEVIGRADPAGSEEYNQELGLSRAQTVAEHLSSRGVAPERIQVRSLGEKDAWNQFGEYVLERRVDVRLTDEEK